METPLIRGTGRADLLALPAIMLGFHPHDSCVVLALDGSRVKFCARADLDWFATAFDRIADQILTCAANVDAEDFVVIGYGDPDLASIAVAELVDVIGPHHVIEALLTDGSSYWSLSAPGEPVRYRFDTSSVAAQAVYEGLVVCDDREEAIVPVRASCPPAEHVVLSAERSVARLSSARGLRRLQALAEGGPLSDPDALQLAVLLADEDRFSAVLTQLTTTSADAYWERLVEARAVCPERHEPNLLALLALASWLSGRGAAHASCLDQLARRSPDHPVLGLLSRLHRDGVPPRFWDG